MKFILAATLTASASACFSSYSQNECNAFSEISCDDQCSLYKSGTACPTGCTWTEQSMMGITMGTCSRSSDATTCSGSTESACEANANCKYMTNTCNYGPQCSFVSPCSASTDSATCPSQYCTFSVASNSCRPDFMKQPDCGKDSCGPECTTSNECTDKGVCGWTNQASCVLEEGCFWMEAAGGIKTSGTFMGESQSGSTTASPICLPCYTDPSETKSSYKWAKANANSGCSLFVSVDLSIVSMEMSGSVDIISATAGQYCESATSVSTVAWPGLEEITAVDPSAVVHVDCSYAVGQAPYGTSGAMMAAPALVVAAVCLLL